MRASIRKWGNSAAVRVPAAVMEEARLAVDQPVDIRAESGRVVIEPLAPEPAALDLDELLSGVTPENLHGEVDFGAPVGREPF